MSWADPVSPAPSGALDEEKADTVWDAREGSRAEADVDPDDLPAEEVPPYATAGGVLEGLMASCLGVCVSVLQGCCGEAGGQSLGLHWPRFTESCDWLEKEIISHKCFSVRTVDKE